MIQCNNYVESKADWSIVSIKLKQPHGSMKFNYPITNKLLESMRFYSEEELKLNDSGTDYDGLY